MRIRDPQPHRPASNRSLYLGHCRPKHRHSYCQAQTGGSNGRPRIYDGCRGTRCWGLQRLGCQLIIGRGGSFFSGRIDGFIGRRTGLIRVAIRIFQLAIPFVGRWRRRDGHPLCLRGLLDIMVIIFIIRIAMKIFFHGQIIQIVVRMVFDPLTRQLAARQHAAYGRPQVGTLADDFGQYKARQSHGSRLLQIVIRGH